MLSVFSQMRKAKITKMRSRCLVIKRSALLEFKLFAIYKEDVWNTLHYNTRFYDTPARGLTLERLTQGVAKPLARRSG